MTTTVRFLQGDAIHALKSLPNDSVDCVVTSPPYWNLRDYGVDGQIGLEETVESYLARLVQVFREVRRVLVPTGTCWVNIGDTYVQSGGRGAQGETGARADRRYTLHRGAQFPRFPREIPPKSLLGIPWRLALAMQADGWLLRQEIIWHKPSPMPESALDRCTRAHEPVFLFTRQGDYHWDRLAMAEPVTGNAHRRGPMKTPAGWVTDGRPHSPVNHQTSENHPKTAGVTPKSAPPGSRIRANTSFHAATTDLVERRNRRSVWTIPSEPCRDAHFATFPRALVRPCILAGCPAKGTVLDPFAGSGTVGVVAIETARNAILIDLNPEYLEIAKDRIRSTTPGLGI